MTTKAGINTKDAYKNLLVVSIAYFFLFTAFMAIQNIQSSLHDEPGLGFASLAAIYAAMLTSCVFVPKLIMSKLSIKTVMIISMLGYVLYTVANFFPMWSTLIPASVITGFCAAPLWTTHSAYITNIASRHAHATNQSANAVISKFFSIFYVLFQTAQIVGNVISSSVFSQATKKSVPSIANFTNVNYTCGAGYCPANDDATDFESTHHGTVNILMGIYLGFGCAGVLSIILFLQKLKEEPKKSVSVLNLCLSTMKEMKKTQYLLLIPITMLSGLEQAFAFGEYTKAYVSCQIGIDSVGYIMICFGVTACITSLILGLVVKWTGTFMLMVTGTLLHGGLLVWLLLWDTTAYPLSLFYVTASLCGVVDAIWLSQTNAIYGIFFENKEAAFSIYRLWQSLGFVVSFALGSYVCLQPKIFILIGFLSLGMIFYCIAEFRYRRQNKMSFRLEETVIENIQAQEI